MSSETNNLITKQDLSEAKTIIIKWMIITFVVIVFMLLGLYATIIFK